MPLSIFVETYGTGKVDDATIVDIISSNFDLRPGSLAHDLNLIRPIFQKTACYGHFGRPEFSWEQPKKLDY